MEKPQTKDEPPAIAKIVKPAMVLVNRSIGKNSDDPEVTGEEEVLAVHEFVTAPAEVGSECALTLNLGNFESAKISVSLKLPCYVEEVDKAYEFAQRWVEDRLKKERDMIDSWRKNDRKINPL